MINEERNKAIRILQWLHGNNFLFRSTEEDVKFATEYAIKALQQEPCEDYISREHLLEEIASLKESPWFKDDTNCAMAIRKEAIEIVEDLCIRKEPSVNPQKIGHWIADVDKCGDVVTTVNGYRCDKCNTFNADKDNYCPNCGAKMVDPQESEE